MSNRVPLNFAFISVAALLGLGVVAYFSWSFFSFKKPAGTNNKRLLSGDDSNEAEDVEEGDEEEEEDDEEEEDEEEQEDEREVREKYDQLIGLAKKLLAGEAHKRAADAFTEAIKLVERLPSAEKDLTVLYNNRSAMYEKQQLYNESLSDIEVVLFREPNHVKARGRRARIYEAQGKLEEALLDYVYVMLTDQVQQKDATASASLVDRVAKKVASKKAAKLMIELKNNNHTYPSPSKTFSKQFFESFPSCYRWKAEYLNVDRESLVAAVGASEGDSIPDRVKHTLDLIRFEIHSKRFNKAFEIINNAVTKLLVQTASSSLLTAEYPTDISAQLTKNLSSYHELLGSYQQLMCKLGDAETEYRTALTLNPANIDAKLKLIMLLGEFGEYENVETQYGEWLLALISGVRADAVEGGDETIPPVSLTVADRVAKAWVLTHRAGLWTSRNADGQYRAECIDKALADINAARALVDETLQREDVTATQREELKGAKYVALYKAQYVLNHTKGQMAIPLSDEDKEYVKLSAAEAAALYPDSDNSRLQDFESAMMEDDVEKALQLVEEGISAAQRASDAALESAYTLYKANAVSTKAFGVLMDPSGGPAVFQTLMGEVAMLQERAATLDPCSADAISAQVQVKCMMGDVDSALPLAERALKLVRTRDEAQDIYQQYFMTQAQAESMKEFKSR